jgi:dipeptide/tripeptide permease
VTEFCERLAYYGFAGSLVLFFETKLNLSNEDAINQFYLWNGFVYVTPLIGGYVADTVSALTHSLTHSFIHSCHRHTTALLTLSLIGI